MGSYNVYLADKDGEVKISKNCQPTVCMVGADPGLVRVRMEIDGVCSDWAEFNAQNGSVVNLRVGGAR
jgi:hypothetical protein